MEYRIFLLLGLACSGLILECFAEINQNFRSDSPMRLKRSNKSQLGDQKADDYYINSQENDENCTRLRPDSKRSNVSHEHNMLFNSLIDGKFDDLINSSKHKDVILIMGNTGVGKTVLTQIIAGDLNHVHAVKTHTDNLVIVDDFERISTPSVVSRTLIPELVVKIENGTTLAFYDCPGFDDTRGPVQDVAASFFINQIVSKVTRVKIIFLVLHSSVTLGHDRVDFDLMVEHATRFVKNVTKFKDSIGLVATKADNYSKMGKYLRDGSIKMKIVEFLEKYNETMHNFLTEYSEVNDTSTLEKIGKTKKKIEFVNILLEKDASNKYSRITFSRDPEKCGALSNSTEVANTKKRVEDLCNFLSYSNVGSHNENFGFSLKPETVLEINSKYAPELNKKIVGEIENLVENFKIWFDTEKQKKIMNCSNSIEDHLVRLADHSSLTFNNLLTQNHNNFSINSVLLGRVLKSGFNQIGFIVPDSFVEFMKKQDDLLDFLQSAVGSNTNLSRINDWLGQLSGLRETIMGIYIPDINNKIIEEVGNLVDDFKTWLDGVKVEGFENKPISMATVFKNSSSPIIMNSNGNSIRSAAKFGRTLKNGFKQVGYSVPDTFVKFMGRQDEFFQFFKSIVGSEINLLKTIEWMYPLSSLRNNITKTYLPETNERILKKIAELVSSFENWFDNVKIENIENYSTSMAATLNEMVEQASISIGKILVNLSNNRGINENSITTVYLSKTLKVGLNEIGFEVPESFMKFMETQNVMFHIFQKIVGHEHVLLKINDWSSSLVALQAKLVEYKSWYGFCASLQSALSTHSFHESKTNLIWNSLQTSLGFIEENRIVPVSQNIKYLSGRYGSASKQVQLLHKIITYANTPVTISCTGNTITVTGHFVRFGAFLDGNGNARMEIYSCLRRNLEKCVIEVYASNTIFIDESLNGEGLHLNIVLVSPKWKIVGRPHINLNGKKGLDIYPTKASEGVNAGDAGYPGLAGRPGDSGGVFVGIAGKIEDGRRLKVTCNGGHGGAGQDGGDGRKGNDGKPPNNSETWFDSEIVTGAWNEHWRRFQGHPGNPGGDGGDGGVCGVGGLPGKIYLKSLSDESYLGVQISQNSGNRGNFGRGGLGGEGGNPGKALICHAANIFGITVDRYKCRQIDSSLGRATNGNIGKNNYSQLGFSQPIATTHKISKEYCVYTFKSLFSEIWDVDCKKFIERLDQNYQ